MNGIRNLLIATLVAAAACGGGGASNSVTNPTGGNPMGEIQPGGTDTPAATNAVAVGDNIFTSVRTSWLPSATTVTWTWSPNVTTHNVMFSDGANSADQATGTFRGPFRPRERLTIHARCTPA